MRNVRVDPLDALHVHLTPATPHAQDALQDVQQDGKDGPVQEARAMEDLCHVEEHEEVVVPPEHLVLGAPHELRCGAVDVEHGPRDEAACHPWRVADDAEPRRVHGAGEQVQGHHRRLREVHEVREDVEEGKAANNQRQELMELHVEPQWHVVCQSTAPARHGVQLQQEPAQDGELSQRRRCDHP